MKTHFLKIGTRDDPVTPLGPYPRAYCGSTPHPSAPRPLKRYTRVIQHVTCRRCLQLAELPPPIDTSRPAAVHNPLANAHGRVSFESIMGFMKRTG